MAERSGSLRCALIALLMAWVVMVFGTSALLVLAGLAGATNGASGLSGLLAATWQAGDDVGPAAKLLLIAIFAALVLAGERIVRVRAPWHGYVLNACLGVAAMLLTLGLIPQALSRGFGIGLTGARFEPSALPFYLAGGLLGAITFTQSAGRCRGRTLHTSGG